MADYQHDEHILSVLKNGDEKQLTELYQSYQDHFIGFIVKLYQCDRNRAIEIYPESMSEMYFNIRNGKLEAPLRSTLKTYLFTIGRYVYSRRFLDKFHTSVGAYTEYTQQEETYEHGDRNMVLKERAKMVNLILSALGDPCDKLLRRIYFDRFSYEAISTEMKTNEGVLRKRKFDCLKKFRRLLNERNIEL